METYLQSLNQLDSEVNLALTNNNFIVACIKLSELIIQQLEFSFALMAEFDFASSQQSFNSLLEQINIFNSYYQQIIDNKELDNESEESMNMQMLFEENKVHSLVATTFSYFCSALFNNINRNPGIAAVYFGKAEKSFNDLGDKTGDIIYKIYGNYCNALTYSAEALEDIIRVNFGNAKVKSQRAKILLEKVIKELEQLKDNELYSDFYEKNINLFKSDYQTVKSYYFISDAKYQFNNHNFKNAAEQFKNVVTEFDISIKNYLKSSDNEMLKNIMLGEYHHYLGWQLLSEAELYRESENWEEAFSTYESVKKEWEHASDFYLQSGMPSASAMQETILNISVIIDVYKSVCNNEKKLKERIYNLQKELEEFKDELFKAFKPTGTIINNTQDVITSVEQNVQFIQNIENTTREQIKELLEAVTNLKLDDFAKNEVEKKGREILSSNEKSHKFFEKVKDFTKDVAELIKNSSEIASPLLPLFKYLSLLFV